MVDAVHPERRTTGERTIEALGWQHARIPRRLPWRNGIRERSNRTDNEACSQRQECTSSAERRCVHRLWEMEYAAHRPHQGLDGATPLEVFCRNYPWHAASMGART